MSTQNAREAGRPIEGWVCRGNAPFGRRGDSSPVENGWSVAFESGVYIPRESTTAMAVLVPYDGSMPAQQAIEYAVETADEQLVLLRVVEAASGTVGAGIDLLQESLKKEPEELRAEVADEVEDTLDQSDIAYEIETAAGKPDREIVAYAEEHDIDQIVMGSHGRTGTSRILLGSVAEKVVRRAPVTVTVVR